MDPTVGIPSKVVTRKKEQIQGQELKSLKNFHAEVVEEKSQDFKANVKSQDLFKKPRRDNIDPKCLYTFRIM